MSGRCGWVMLLHQLPPIQIQPPKIERAYATISAASVPCQDRTCSRLDQAVIMQMIGLTPKVAGSKYTSVRLWHRWRNPLATVPCLATVTAATTSTSQVGHNFSLMKLGFCREISGQVQKVQKQRAHHLLVEFILQVTRPCKEPLM
jgi:hypothetical protein